MKTVLTILFFCLFIFSISAQVPGYSLMITEIHYDNTGLDTDEFIEIYINDPQPSTLTDIKIDLYQGKFTVGSYGTVYSSFDLGDAGVTSSVTPNGMYYKLPVPGIQNGGGSGCPGGGACGDGIALSNDGTLIEFISYEGILDASAGIAAGMTSVLITSGNGLAGSVVSENSGTAVGESMQQNGFGAWTANVPASAPLENPNDTGGPFGGNLPIELSSFDVSQNGFNVDLKWVTEMEINNDYFEIEYSKDGVVFETLDRVMGSGFSTSKSNYQYLHSNLQTGMHYYRLSQFDFDGKVTKYDVKFVWLTALDNVHLYPTIANSYINLSGVEDDLKVQIFDQRGVMVKELIIQEGSIDISSLASGMYYLKVSDSLLSFVKE